MGLSIRQFVRGPGPRAAVRWPSSIDAVYPAILRLRLNNRRLSRTFFGRSLLDFWKRLRCSVDGIENRRQCVDCVESVGKIGPVLVDFVAIWSRVPEAPNPEAPTVGFRRRIRTVALPSARGASVHRHGANAGVDRRNLEGVFMPVYSYKVG
jgi:hypothetical protein